MTTTTRFAAIQIDTRTVYGIGRSENEARTDALRYGASLDGVRLVPITAAAFDYVAENGGAPSDALTVSRSGVCLRSEE